MRKLFLLILNLKLKIFAKLILWRYKPTIVGITGTVGKTSTKTVLYTMLKRRDLRVRMAGGNLNNETGLPLSVIGEFEKIDSFYIWFKAILQAIWVLIDPIGKKKYPEILILEYAADHPGDIKYLTKIAKPDIAIVTAVGETPVHIEFYENQKEVAKEKAGLVEALKDGGLAILNADDGDVSKMAKDLNVQVKTFGENKLATVRISDFKNISEKSGPIGASFKLGVSDREETILIKNLFGESQAYAFAAASIAAMELGLSFEQAVGSASIYRGSPGRSRLIKGVKGSTIIDDSYNASPLSMKAALGVLSSLRGERRIAVLGDMLELGKHSEQEHIKIGKKVSEVADLFIGVGENMKVAVEEAKKKMGSNARHYKKIDEATKHIEEIIRSGDIVLVKGSQSIRTEKIIPKIMLHPQEAKSLLVRQYGSWLE
ncbi:MAG: hypothetical protein COT88_01705 [Candidatus Colwellbacteria bacterium CG10_big_fil_rev_8_21_14_0_10_41_28]|uniref:UDP-N-acetylmuramoyl-tripeptide--D-alanyl-D-alanine ligase n=1 Tax=Candidatus Colwellbacteria bacterium CG10_big_fil_rev_8_21_14_0_10_41_28 TaxID=1974539 RepID=A0A2H0VH41_9BACT|nr:MAG: hypothetical protein COT88_01705 [Candidatus Colwellbacteria bacterium CG10_big_fil_rev_8_21_14_0_10_41_28]